MLPLPGGDVGLPHDGPLRLSPSSCSPDSHACVNGGLVLPAEGFRRPTRLPAATQWFRDVLNRKGGTAPLGWRVRRNES